MVLTIFLVLLPVWEVVLMDIVILLMVLLAVAMAAVGYLHQAVFLPGIVRQLARHGGRYLQRG